MLCGSSTLCSALRRRRLASVGLVTGREFIEHGEGGIEDLAGLIAPCFAGLVHGRGGEGKDSSGTSCEG